MEMSGDKNAKSSQEMTREISELLTETHRFEYDYEINLKEDENDFRILNQAVHRFLADSRYEPVDKENLQKKLARMLYHRYTSQVTPTSFYLTEKLGLWV